MKVILWVMIAIFGIVLIYAVWGFYSNPSISVEDSDSPLSQKDLIGTCNRIGGGVPLKNILTFEISNNFILPKDYVLPNIVICSKLENGNIAEHLTFITGFNDGRKTYTSGNVKIGAFDKVSVNVDASSWCSTYCDYDYEEEACKYKEGDISELYVFFVERGKPFIKCNEITQRQIESAPKILVE